MLVALASFAPSWQVAHESRDKDRTSSSVEPYRACKWINLPHLERLEPLGDEVSPATPMLPAP